MTRKQYSDAQRALGVLEGFEGALPDYMRTAAYRTAIDVLSDLIEAMKPEADDGDDTP